jgi:hypothetical protein
MILKFLTSVAFLSALLAQGFAAALTPPQDEQVVDLTVPVGMILEVIDLESILAALSEVDIVACIDKYDPNILPYLRSQDFREIHTFLWTNPNFLKIIHFFARSGYPNVYDSFNHLFEFFGLPYRVDEKGPIDDGPEGSPASTGRACSNPERLLEVLKQSISEDDVVSVLLKLVKSDPNVRALIELIKTPEMKQFIKDFSALPRTQKLIQYGNDHDIPIHQVLYLIQK